ncbi:MAG: dienelactone hydrolase family protein [Actinomycetota bacterium]|nr:dienelactone hydrolase family protein [Acidimicrobiia bacterium]MDQ3293903.1 dienelactone hydrolase family protein [Actinomycetota bacterium]
MSDERTETITASDGGTFDGWLFLPPNGRGPGILLLQEIFGVGEFLRGKAIDLAARGYVVLCPDVFWRSERRVAHGHDEAGLQQAFASLTKWQAETDDATNVGDLLAALAHLRGMRAVDSAKVAVMGYCLGGRLAYEVSVAGDPDACVAYYGSGIGERVDATAGEVSCPTLFHYGDSDPFIPNEENEAVQAAFAGNDDVTVHVHAGGGHAFENEQAEQFWNTACAERSWSLTLAFLAEQLQPPTP